MRTAQLSAVQIAYLTTATYLHPELREALINALDAGGNGSISLDATTADTVQSALTDRLGQAGFGTDYDLADEGAMLEDLIDAFADE